MDRREFVLGLGGFALASRVASADEKELGKPEKVAAAADQDRGVVPLHGIKEAVHIGESELPFVATGPGTEVQVLQVDLNQGLWVVRTRFHPGTTIDKHYHTGPVFAVTFAGSWFYKEYPDYKNTKGSYLYEPAHSVHTLTVPESNKGITDVWFAITGANLNMDERGEVTSVVDAHSILTAYRQLCRDRGLSSKKVMVVGE